MKEKKTDNTEPETAAEPAPEAAEAVQTDREEKANAEQKTDEVLNKAQADAEEFKRKWYAVTAEYENYRKRTASARTQAYNDGRADVVVKLFPIADNLERALKSCAEEKTAQGLEMVMKSFRKILEDEKITEIDPVGQPFDPEKSEAIMAIEGEGESGTVTEVYLKGYEREGRVLRFAQVVVRK